MKRNYIRRTLVLASLSCASSVALADRYGICEGSSCGGGFLNALGGIVLLLVFLGWLGPKKAAIFMTIWLAPAGILSLMGEKNFALVWFLFGWMISMAISWKLFDVFFPENKDQVNDRSQ